MSCKCNIIFQSQWVLFSCVLMIVVVQFLALIFAFCRTRVGGIEREQMPEMC